MLELLISSLSTSVIMLFLIGCLVLTVFAVLMPFFVFRIKNILEDINKKITKLLDN